MLGAALHEGEPWATSVLLAGDAGLRIGEVLALEWPDLDLVANTITVSRQIRRNVLGPTKGGKPRTVPMTPRLASHLRSVPRIHVGRVVANVGGDPMTEGLAKHGIYRVCRVAGLPEKSWHLLRHNTESSIMPRALRTSMVRRRRERSRIVNWSELSEALQEAQQSVAGTVSNGPRVSRRSTGKGSLLEFEISGEVHLRRFDRLVAEAKRDDGPVNASLQELHGRGVAKHMGRHAFALQR